MRAEALLIRRCEEIAVLQAGAETELDLLDIAARLRQILFDKHCLVDAANVNKLKLTFVVGAFNIRMPPPRRGIMAIGDGLDPSTGPPTTHLALTRAEFGAHIAMYLDTEPVTVKDIIKYAANVAGGVHLDPKNSKDEYRTLKVFEGWQLKGVSTGGAHLQAIARVSLRALDPLIIEARNRLTCS